MVNFALVGSKLHRFNRQACLHLACLALAVQGHHPSCPIHTCLSREEKNLPIGCAGLPSFYEPLSSGLFLHLKGNSTGFETVSKERFVVLPRHSPCAASHVRTRADAHLFVGKARKVREHQDGWDGKLQSGTPPRERVRLRRMDLVESRMQQGWKEWHSCPCQVKIGSKPMNCGMQSKRREYCLHLQRTLQISPPGNMPEC